MEKTRNYKSIDDYAEISFGFVNLNVPARWNAKVYSRNEAKYYQGTVSKSNSGIVMFNSTQLGIVASWLVDANSLVGFDSFDLMFNYSKKYPLFRRNFNFKNMQGPTVDW